MITIYLRLYTYGNITKWEYLPLYRIWKNMFPFYIVMRKIDKMHKEII